MLLKKTFAELASYYAISQAAKRFSAALLRPQAAQQQKLFALLQSNQGTDFGKRFGFSSIRSIGSFQARVPLSSYQDYAPSIEAIKRGEKGVLTQERVERLHLTSGTAGKSKHLPFTRGLQKEFFAGIGPWLENLRRFYPEAMNGPSYWVISPPCATPECDGSAVPIGFDEDSAYLPRSMRFISASNQVVPGELKVIADSSQFYYFTASFLLRSENLSFLSLWSPSFLRLILEAVAKDRRRLLDEIYSGTSVHLPGRTLRLSSDRNRARLLDRVIPGTAAEVLKTNWGAVWPALRLISCWKDGWSQHEARVLSELFPSSQVQGKGLLATEAFVTLPYLESAEHEEAPLLSICSHFFEFFDDRTGQVSLPHQLKPGSEYEVVISTSGGLYRYRLGDRVRCEALRGDTPRLRFIGRRGVVSDLSGEKLDSEHLEKCLDSVLNGKNIPRDPAFLAPLTAGRPPCYALYVSLESPGQSAGLAMDIDRALRANFYYDQCRRAGQLGPPVVRNLDAGLRSRYYEAKRGGQRESTRKETAFEPDINWDDRLSANSDREH